MRLILLLVVLGCWPLPAWAALGLSPRDQAAELLAQSRAAVARADSGRALELALAAASADPQWAETYRWLGWLYERKGLRPEALDAYARAAALQPGAEAQAILSRVFAQGNFPETLARNTPARLPGEWRHLTLHLDDPRLPTDRQGHWGLLVCLPGDTRDDRAVDLRYQGNYAQAAYVLLLPPGAARWQLVCRVHWGEERALLARDCACLAGALLVVARAYLGPAWTATRPLDIWLAETGRPGAEGWEDNIYLWQVGAARQPTEWVRQLAHELGHAGLGSGIGDFGEPERWADGRVGELLFTGWLLAARVDQGDALPWLTPALSRWHGEQVTWCLAALAEAGGPERMAGQGQSAVDRSAGFLAMLERAFGPRLVASVLTSMREPTAAGVLEAARKSLAAGLERDLEMAAAGWLYWPGGRLQVVSGQGALPGKDNTLLSPQQSPLALSPGWHLVTISSGPLRLRLAAG